jgi:chorismate mutase / prephenate dehydratase
MQENRPNPADSPENGPGTDLESLRRRIDELDRRLIDVLSERARIVVEIGSTKRASGTPIYAPHREKQVIEQALASNPGPLLPRTIEAIYRELMSGSFALELPLRVGYLGPPGSFSHLAAVRHFGSSVEFDDLHEIDHVFEEVAAKRCNYGLVPYENSIGGGITDTLDAFQEHDVTIYAEALIDVAQTLLANCLPNEITRIYSKPQVFS